MIISDSFLIHKIIYYNIKSWGFIFLFRISKIMLHHSAFFNINTNVYILLTFVNRINYIINFSKIKLIYIKRIIFFFQLIIYLIMFPDFIYIEQYIYSIKKSIYLPFLYFRFRCHKTILVIFHLKIIVVLNIC